MHRGKIVALLVTQVIITVCTIQTQAAEKTPIGQITFVGGEVLINGKLQDPIGKGDEPRLLYMDDEIRTGITSGSHAVGIIRGAEFGLAPNEWLKFELREDSGIEAKKLVFVLLYGGIRIKSENLRTRVETKIDETSTTSPATDFFVTSHEEGTVVEVFDGRVELSRNGEDKATEIIRDYKGAISRFLFRIDSGFQHELDNNIFSDNLRGKFAENDVSLSKDIQISEDIEKKGSKWLIVDKERKQTYCAIKRGDKLNICDYTSKDKLITAISPKPLSRKKWIFLSVSPGTGMIYARGDKRWAIPRQVISTGALVGFAFLNSKREGAVKASIRAHDDYKGEIMPHKIGQLYTQHRKDCRNAKIYRNYQIGCAAVYATSLIIEIILMRRDYKEYKKMTEDFRELEEVLPISRASLEASADALLVKAHWHFE